jgi:hypothetical protein
MIDGLAPITRPTELANAVTGFATLFSGLITLLFTYLIAPQPLRWRVAYASIIVTGIPTIWFHGFGETPTQRMADVGSNFVVGLCMVFAVLGDYYRGLPRRLIASALVLLNVLGVAEMLLTNAGSGRLFSIGGVGYSIRQLVLIADSLAATVLLYLRLSQISPRARPLLHAQTLTFLIGAFFAANGNHIVSWQVVSWHALWHLIGAFGFVLIWGFNHVRFAQAAEPHTYSVSTTL